MTSLFSAARLRLWRAGAPIYNLAIREGVRRLIRPAGAGRSFSGRDVRVVGLLSTATGIGQSARLCVQDLLQSGYRVSTRNLSKTFGVDGNVPFDPGSVDADRAADLTIYHLNPPLMLLGLLVSGRKHYYRGLNAAYWAWELPELPPEWVAALDYVDAIMTPSTFCRDVIRNYTTKPVYLVPHPVRRVEGQVARSGAGEGKPFRVLSIFNCGSSLYRKNPFAAVDAFKLAFGTDPDAELVLKVSDGHRHASDIADLTKHIGAARNVRILDGIATEAELDDLIRSADAYVSLHRAEGFGLSVADAVMRGVPVVVTGWSGTQDFCHPDLAFVVDYRLVAMEDPHPAYCHVRSALWAEPSIEMAAQHLQAIRGDPVRAQARAAVLRERLMAHIDAHRYEEVLRAIAAGGALRNDDAPSSAQQTAI